MNNRELVIIDETGKEIVCEILFTHHSDDFNKDYVVYLRKDNNECSAATFIEVGNGEGKLGPVESEDEWKMLEDLLNDFIKNNNNNDSCDCDGGCSGGCSGCAGCASLDEEEDLD